MYKTRLILIASSALVAVSLPSAGQGQSVEAGTVMARDGLQGMVGVWEIERRGPPGTRRRADGQRPQMRGERGGRGRGGPPPRGEPDAENLPGPDIEGLGTGDRRTYAVMTAAGRAAFEGMDPRDLPSNNCMSNGLPSLVGIPDVQEWSVAGDVLTIRYANFNAVRTIFLDGRAAPAERSHLGHSTGAFDGGELVITTTGLTATPGGLGRNAPGSASRSYVERYRLAADGRSVSGSVTITDPEYLTRQLNVPIAFIRPEAGTVVADDIPCSVEASQRYLD